MVIFRILLQMRRELVDLARNNGDLNLGGTRVLFVLLEFSRNAGLYSLRKHTAIIQNISKKSNSSRPRVHIRLRGKSLRKTKKFGMLTA